MLEDILAWCGYNSAFSLLVDNMNNEEMMHLMESIVDSPADAADFIIETIEEIAKNTYEWVDMDALRAKAEDLEYLNYRDGD
jgi:hypothetical protein|tara:strand:- start:1520 stop:1765 length:246 start_codon:yes stop_codon:yes gene_type:complete